MRIILHGRGKMGAALEAIVPSRGHQIVQTYDIDSPLPDRVSGADVIIDFSHATAVEHLFEVAVASGVNVVTGTTGWNDKLESIRASVGEKIGVVQASNFSPGANVLFALARQAGELFAKFPQYAAGMEERHHDQKKDAPSGTALRIAAEVKKGSGGKIDPPIAASRVGKEFGLHTLFFDSEDDLVELSHRARGRQGFARGAVIAAELVQGKKGFFTFEQLLGL